MDVSNLYLSVWMQEGISKEANENGNQGKWMGTLAHKNFSEFQLKCKEGGGEENGVFVQLKSFLFVNSSYPVSDLDPKYHQTDHILSVVVHHNSYRSSNLQWKRHQTMNYYH